MSTENRQYYPTGLDKRAASILIDLSRREALFTPLGNYLWLRYLSEIKRFSAVPDMIHRTDLWTHARRTAYLGALLGGMVAREEKLDIDINKIFRMGYHHDDPEFITGDLPSPLKQALSQEEKQALKGDEARAIKALALLFGHNRPEGYLSDHHEMTAKESPEAQILDIADKLDGLGETLHEIRCGGNPAFIKVLRDYRRLLDEFGKKYDIWNRLRNHPWLGMSKFPTLNQANSIPKIKLEDMKEKNKAWEKLLEGPMPQFYRTWLELSMKIFDVRTEKFLLPGWYLDLWNYWGVPHGTTTASGIYIP